MPGRHGVDCPSLWAGSIGSSASRRATAKPPSPRGCPARARTLRRCTSTLSPPFSSRTCSWMNCGPGYAAVHRCSGCGWPSTPARALLPVLHLGPRTPHAAHPVMHSLRHLLAPGCVPLFTSDGFNLSFSASPSSCWTVAPGGEPAAENTPVASGRTTDLWPSEEKLPEAQAGAGDTRHAPWNRYRSQDREASDGLHWATEHRFD